MKVILLTAFISIGGVGAIVAILAGIIPAKKLSYMGKGIGMFLVDKATKRFGPGIVKPVRKYLENSLISFVVGHDNVVVINKHCVGGIVGGLKYKNNVKKLLDSMPTTAAEVRLREAQNKIKKELEKR